MRLFMVIFSVRPRKQGGAAQDAVFVAAQFRKCQAGGFPGGQAVVDELSSGQAMQVTSNIAFKEWAIVVDALGQGRTGSDPP